jgi:hypothetical protein
LLLFDPAALGVEEGDSLKCLMRIRPGEVPQLSIQENEMVELQRGGCLPLTCAQ